jgi:hypothetical protein
MLRGAGARVLIILFTPILALMFGALGGEPQVHLPLGLLRPRLPLGRGGGRGQGG